MQFTIAALATLLGAALAFPTPRADTTYQIKDFTTRKLDGENISTLSFRILATNGGTLDFECAPYDPLTQATTNNFKADYVYPCAANSLFSFNFIPASSTQTNQLFLWQNVSDGVTYTGNTVFDDPICTAGGSSADDLVCSIPDSVNVSIAMSQV